MADVLKSNVRSWARDVWRNQEAQHKADVKSKQPKNTGVRFSNVPCQEKRAANADLSAAYVASKMQGGCRGSSATSSTRQYTNYWHNNILEDCEHD